MARTSRTLLTCAALLLGLAPVFAQPAGETLPLRLTAFAVNLGVTPDRAPSGQSGTVLITIERWSTSEERAALLADFRAKGSDGLLAALRENPSVGVIRTPDQVGWTLHYAYQVPAEDGGRRIFLATDRRIAFWEAARNSRRLDYPFTLAELRLGPDGRGEGRLSLATKIRLSKDGKVIELENYASEPVRLQSVQVER
jgi:hypothetical protein